MAYFKIGETDFSPYISGLKVGTKVGYNSQQNANLDTIVDYVNKKRTIEVEIIPLDNVAMKTILSSIEDFNVSISYRNPKTGLLENEVNCIIDNYTVSYYTIQSSKVMYQKFNLKFIEL